MTDRKQRTVGIDLGTTFSAVAYLDQQGRPVSIPNQLGELTTPTVVHFSPDKRIVIGRDALRGAANFPESTAFNFKRDMGDACYRRPLNGRNYGHQALSALVLKRLMQDAVEVLPHANAAVITVPAYFGDNRRKATEEAGRIAGIDVADIINEPTAAALADAFQSYLQQGGGMVRLEYGTVTAAAAKTTLVFDLGGGTFDVTVLRREDDHFEVLATGGEVHLGGIDFDRRIEDEFCEEFARRYGADPRDEAGTNLRILHTCEQAKRTLTLHEQTIVTAEHFGRTLHLPLTRKRFEQLTADLLGRLRLSVEMLLEDALLPWDRINEVLLVGGATRMPMISKMLAEVSGKQPRMSDAPDLLVSHGAAIHAAFVEMSRPKARPAIADIAPAASPTGAKGAKRKTPTAAKQKQPATVGGDDAVFSDSVVSASRRITVENVNPHSLGVVVRSSREGRIVNSMLIPSQTPLPTTRTRIFGTEADNQATVRLLVVEGESRDPASCTQIGECVIARLPPNLPRGAPVEVTFRYDANGRVHVRAVDLTHRTTAEAELHHRDGFEEQQLDKMAESLTRLMEPEES